VVRAAVAAAPTSPAEATAPGGGLAAVALAAGAVAAGVVGVGAARRRAGGAAVA
jgi:hypothetical protein